MRLNFETLAYILGIEKASSLKGRYKLRGALLTHFVTFWEEPAWKWSQHRGILGYRFGERHLGA